MNTLPQETVDKMADTYTEVTAKAFLLWEETLPKRRRWL